MTLPASSTLCNKDSTGAGIFARNARSFTESVPAIVSV